MYRDNMAQKVIDFSRVLMNYDGTPLEENEEKITLKKVVIGYILQSSRMNMSDDDQMTLHGLGFGIAKSNGEVTLTTKEYDALKRLVDTGTIQTPQGAKEQLYTNLVRFQVKDAVDEAKTADQTPQDPAAPQV